MTRRPPEPDQNDMFRLPPFEQAWLLPRRVEVKQGNLVYTPSEVVCSGDEGMLRRFLLLADADDEVIADYAHEFGVLQLCVHGQPYLWTHFGPDLGKHCSEAMRDDYERAQAIFAKGRSPAPATAYREPLALWRRWALAFRLALELADRIQSRKPSDPEHTDALAWFLPNGGYPRVDQMSGADSASKAQLLRAQLDWDRWCLADALNSLLDRAVRATINYCDRSDMRPRMRFAGRSLADALVLQLVMAVCRAEDVATCDGCGTVFVPSTRYKPRAGQRRFCEACRAAGVPWKLAARDRRARQRETQEER